MIRKNPDVVAIAILLFGLAAYSAAREIGPCRVIPHPRVVLSNAVSRTIPHFASFRIAELPRL